jgi:hypothetical protein
LEKSGYDCLGQIVQRGLLQAKHQISTPNQAVVDNHLNSVLATSIDGAVVIQKQCDNNIMIYPAQICVIECKTLTTEESLQKGLERLSEVQNILGDYSKHFLKYNLSLFCIVSLFGQHNTEHNFFTIVQLCQMPKHSLFLQV